jgi:Zn-dependent M28 family amino/carboxypeptidase
MSRFLLIVLTCLFAAACERKAPEASPATQTAAAASPAAKRIETDLRTLADDKMEGREAGTRGYDLAADYVAKRYADIGLQPAGDNGSFFQRVPLLKALRLQQGAAFVIERDGRRSALAFREQYLPSLNYDNPRHSLTAPAVFVGQGVHAPELAYDDFAGIDVRGKIAVLFPGAPARFDNDRRAFYSSGAEKLRTLVARGAVGAVFVNTPEQESRSPWTRSMATWDKPGMRLRDADGKGIDTFSQLRAAASASAASAAQIFAGTGTTPEALFKAAEDGKLTSFDLPGTLTLAGSTRIEPAESRNVVAKLPGSDAQLSREHIAYTAHLDHVGIGAPVKGDRIYNGALDNALGISIMLEAARELADAPVKPKRSMLFIALTAEEKGLLGAEWFVRQPTVPEAGLVANINMDMPVMLAPSKDVVPIGVEHSTLKTALDEAAREIGVALSPDPFPEEVVFVRSDQYAFVRAGIPAVYLDGGVVSVEENDTSAKDSFEKFLRQCYHQPCDDAAQPIQYEDAARLAKLNARIGVLVGDAAERPRWNDGDFFGDRFAPAAK